MSWLQMARLGDLPRYETNPGMRNDIINLDNNFMSARVGGDSSDPCYRPPGQIRTMGYTEQDRMCDERNRQEQAANKPRMGIAVGRGGSFWENIRGITLPSYGIGQKLPGGGAPGYDTPSGGSIPYLSSPAPPQGATLIPGYSTSGGIKPTAFGSQQSASSWMTAEAQTSDIYANTNFGAPTEAATGAPGSATESAPMKGGAKPAGKPAGRTGSGAAKRPKAAKGSDMTMIYIGGALVVAGGAYFYMNKNGRR